MSSPRRDWCRKGLHDLRDPANVTWRKDGKGRRHRCCRECRNASNKQYMRAQRRAASSQPAIGRAALQLIADGATYAEAAEIAALSPGTLDDQLVHVRRRYGVTSTAAAVYAALMCGDITPVRRARQPLPSRNNTTRNHARSLTALLRGERTARRGRQGAGQQQMLDDLYAFTEAHAVSVLWAAGMLARDGEPRWIATEKDGMDRHATAA